MERSEGIEPSPQAWQARILPLNHDRKTPAYLEHPGGFSTKYWKFGLERVAGIEPVLSSLEGLGTTPIPYPRISLIYRLMPGCQDQIMCKITEKYSTTYLPYN
jgi:hypothetical protein